MLRLSPRLLRHTVPSFKYNNLVGRPIDSLAENSLTMASMESITYLTLEHSFSYPGGILLTSCGLRLLMTATNQLFASFPF